MNDVANDKSCAAIDINGDYAFKIILFIFFGVIWNNFLQFFKVSPVVDTVQLINAQNFSPVGFDFL